MTLLHWFLLSVAISSRHGSWVERLSLAVLGLYCWVGMIVSHRAAKAREAAMRLRRKDKPLA